MNKIFLGMFALVLGLAATSEASAAPHHAYPARGHVSYSRPTYGRYTHAAPSRVAPYLRYGVRYSRGYYFRVRPDYWGAPVWTPVYRRYQYYDTYLQVYYYLDPVSGTYVPVTPVAVPVPVAPVYP
jgi:hypothetical protein